MKWTPGAGGYGRIRDGYASDMTRMLFLGTPGARVKGVYGRCSKPNWRPSMRCGRANMANVDRQARKVLKAYKLEGAFVHPRATAWGWRSTNRHASAKRTRRRWPPAWRSLSSPAFISKDSAVSGSRIRWWNPYGV